MQDNKEDINQGVERTTNTSEKPFTIALQRLDERSGGYFTPGATITLSPSLRTSGLLLALPPDEVKHLLFLLTFVHPNGHCTPSIKELAQAMRVSEAKVRSRMRRLCEFRWQGRPVAIEIERESGLDAVSLSPSIVCFVAQGPEPQPQVQAQVQAARPVTGRPTRREQVIAYSREHYARSRAEVETEMAERMDWDIPKVEETSEVRTARREMHAVGVSREQADFLLSNFDMNAIRQQIEWLPYRSAKNPAAFLVAAIEGDYEEPLGLRISRSSEEMEVIVADEPLNNSDH